MFDIDLLFMFLFTLDNVNVQYKNKKENKVVRNVIFEPATSTK